MFASVATPTTLRLVGPAEPAWDAAVTRLGGSVFHTAAWAEVLRATYGYSPAYLLAERDREPRAALPLMEVASWLTGRRGVALPFTDECGAIGDADAAATLFREAQLHGVKRRWRYLEVRGELGAPAASAPSLGFYGHRVDLRAPESALFARLDSANRRAIRKAQSSGVTVELTTAAAAVDVFYRLQQVTRKRHGLPPQPASFFRHVHAQFIARQRGCIAIARDGERPVASAMFLYSADTVLFKFGASDERFQHLRANNLMMWEAIRQHAGRHFTSLDLGRTSLGNEGLRAFKLSWGATEHRISYRKYAFGRGAFIADQDRSSGPLTRFFRAMPLGGSQLIGRLLYRHIA